MRMLRLPSIGSFGVSGLWLPISKLKDSEDRRSEADLFDCLFVCLCYVSHEDLVSNRALPQMAAIDQTEGLSMRRQKWEHSEDEERDFINR